MLFIIQKLARAKMELKEELKKELVMYQGISSSETGASCVIREYRYSITVQLT
jgi:hypothetical protein